MTNLDTLLYAADLLEKGLRRRHPSLGDQVADGAVPFDTDMHTCLANVSLGKRSYPFAEMLARADGKTHPSTARQTSPSHQSSASSSGHGSSESPTDWSHGAHTPACTSPLPPASSKRGSVDSGVSTASMHQQQQLQRRPSRYVKRDELSRAEHNTSEKTRRANLRTRLDQLSALLPQTSETTGGQVVQHGSVAATNRHTTLNLLRRTVDHMKSLHKQQQQLTEEQADVRRQNELLRRHVQLLQNQNRLQASRPSGEHAPVPVTIPSIPHASVVADNKVRQTSVIHKAQASWQELLQHSQFATPAITINATPESGSFGRFAAPSLPPELLLHICANLLNCNHNSSAPPPYNHSHM